MVWCVAAASKEYLALLHGDFSLGIILSDLWSTNSACSLGRIGLSDSMSRFGDEMLRQQSKAHDILGACSKYSRDIVVTFFI